VLNSPNQLVRFGEFSADLEAAELYRNGVRLRLQGQPFAVLALLLERPGRLIVREEFHRRLWPSDTFVDFEHGLNAAVNRLREALGDPSDTPRYIETIPRRGYRFIAKVEGSESPGKGPSGSDTRRRSLRLVISGTLVLILVVAGTGWWLRSRRLPHVTTSTRLTFSGRVSGQLFGEYFSSLATDGNRIYFVTVKNGVPTVAYISVAGGQENLIPAGLDWPQLRQISPDASNLLVYGALQGRSDDHLWLLSTGGGGLRRLMNIDGQDGTWSPDGHRFLYAKGQTLYSGEADGSNATQLVKSPGKAYWIRWSPDAKRIRFTSVDQTTGSQTLWECMADGTNLHRVVLSSEKQPQECCADWTVDGKYFVFRSAHDQQADIWLVRDKDTNRRARLTTGPLQTVAAVPSANGKKLFVIGVQPKAELQKYDFRTHRTVPYLAGTSAWLTSASRDGRWLAYVELRGKEGILWRSRPDGTDKLQLTEPRMVVGWSSWSPDGAQIAFMAKLPDRPWTIYVVAANGGSPRAVLSDEHNSVDPEWSADGKSLIFGRPPAYMIEASAPRGIYLLNIETGRVSTIPGSEGFYSPHWSPNGRYVVAMPMSEDRLMLFDFQTQRWTKLIDSPLGIATTRWSPDSEYIYFDHHIRDALIRVGRKNRTPEKVLDLASANPNASECDFDNMTSDGSPLIACWIDDGDIYTLDLGLP
jgi:Tol biopolymer transport system component/DNA-binding winged helix-turn-helix (wHTH) protein